VLCGPCSIAAPGSISGQAHRRDTGG